MRGSVFLYEGVWSDMKLPGHERESLHDVFKRLIHSSLVTARSGSHWFKLNTANIFLEIEPSISFRKLQARASKWHNRKVFTLSSRDADDATARVAGRSREKKLAAVSGKEGLHMRSPLSTK